jgi:hypothetical protein
MASDTLHVHDTPVPVLAPGSGKTKTGRLWTYVRDERQTRAPITARFATLKTIPAAKAIA